MFRRSLAAVLLSSVLFWAGTGLAPIPWLTWLAPLPVLLLAPRVPARVAAGVAFVAWFLGALNMWSYLHGSIELPVPALVGYLVGTAVPFPLAVLLGRASLLRGRPLLATVAVPATLSGAEYLVSLVSPAGGFWSLAYTQTDVALVRDIAAVTGMWGMTFLVMAVPTVIAVLLAPGTTRRLPIAGVAVGLAAMVVGYGLWPSSSALGPTVTLIALEQSEDSLPVASPEGRLLLDRYAERVRAAHTEIAVLPEKVFRVDDDLPSFITRFSSLAVQSRTDVVVGLVSAGYNSAMLFRADGTPPIVYHKRHLVPGLEDHLRVGHSAVVVDGLGLAVCKDFDYPALGRENARRGARLMLVPALDFDRDAWLHSRMAVMRGVESGFAVARSAGHGYRTISTADGEIIGTSRVPLPTGPTPYSRLGDWFAWSCLLVTAIAGIRSWTAVRGRGGVVRATGEDGAAAPRIVAAGAREESVWR
jgi:apolipoprotein N-acyltransferase